MEELGNTNRNELGFGSTGTSEPLQRRTTKPIYIKEISAQAFGTCPRKGDITGILRWEGDEDPKLRAINISTELAIKNRKPEDTKNWKEGIPREYHRYLDAFEKDDKTTLPPHPDGVDLRIDL